MKKFTYILIASLLSFFAKAQQESQFTNFMHNMLLLNPAYAGVQQAPAFTLIHRSQWLGFKGAPTTQVLSFNTPVFGQRAGFGISLFHKTAGISNSWSGSMAYSYNLKLADETSLRLGLHATVKSLGMDFSSSKVVVRDLNDPSAANGTNMDQYTGNFGMGLFLKHKNYFFGASVPKFYPNELGFNAETLITAEEKPHFYVMGGASFVLSDKVDFIPVFLVKYVKNAPADMDVNLSVVFEEEVSVGLSYRTGGTGYGESIDLLLFYQISSKVGAGLGYDFSISELAKYNSGSFEALLKYKLSSDREDLSNPRFF